MSGNVSRCLKYHEKKIDRPDWYRRQQESAKRSNLKRKKRINKRCVDCGKLIGPTATRCQSHASKHMRKNKKWSSHPENKEK